jgi:hypothetical protein
MARLLMDHSRRFVKELIPKKIRFRLRRIYYWVRALFYAGTRVWCPWCGRRFRKFPRRGPYFGPNLNTFCPRCGGFERHRLLWLYFKNRTNLFQETLSVLHVAPEYGVWKRLQHCPNLDYVSADLNSPLAVIHMDLTRMPFQDNRFDVILCNHVLEHIPDDREAMRELLRVLRPGGWAVLLVPIDLARPETFEDASITSPRDRERVFGQHDHVRLYGRDFVDRLAQAGFQVLVDNYGRSLDPDTLEAFGVNPREDLYIGSKL